MSRLIDLTRWNRAGLTRFRYVDGNAAVWLEELRIGLLAQYLRGIPPDERLPEKWRDLFLKKENDWELMLPQSEFAEAVAWAALLPQPPVSPETGGTRARRLADQYGRRSTDYGWELVQAFARAAHILLEHLNAYANEGYLPTATQWDNLRKLVAAVNYLPTPPASATTIVGLHIAEGAGAIEIAAGLATKYARPEGGPPLIFETLKPVVGHPDLNAARAVGWNRNETRIDISTQTRWIVPAKARLAPGDLAVLADSGVTGSALGLAAVERDEDAGLAFLTFDPPGGARPPLFDTTLYIEPDGVRLGLPENTPSHTVLNVAGATSIPVNSVVEIRFDNNAKVAHAVVTESKGNQLVVSGLSLVAGSVEVEPYTPIGADVAGDFAAGPEVSKLYFKRIGGTVAAQDHWTTHEVEEKFVSRKFARPPSATGIAYANLGGNRTFNGAVVSGAPSGFGGAGAMVRFEGKPPKGLKAGDWYVARPVGSTSLTALKVVGIRIEAEFHYVKFHAPFQPRPEKTEFFGPMTRRLPPLGHDRSPAPAIVGGVAVLEGLSPEAHDLVKPGRTALVVFEPEGEQRKAAQAVIGEVESIGDRRLRLTLVSETGFAGWKKGWTTFHLNTVGLSHGETKAPKVLGSGDAEKRRQDFRFKVDSVSFVPSSASTSGVAPDMDVAVDGVKWEYRDLGDPLAEGADAWSFRLNGDDSLQIEFRRRLPTGKNNLTVPRHRVGVGLSGTAVPPWSFTEPVKKNRFVTAITQPFATSGGADREPVSAMRENAPANLAANGRAVSLRDFERLCRRHSSVWQAHAREVLGVTTANLVDIVIVPSGGGAVTAALKDDLIRFARARALPGIRITISPYQAVPVKMAVTARVDAERYDKSDVHDALLAALTDTFSLARRRLGQPVYVAEILAAAERVDGVETVVVNAFARKPGAPAPLREAAMSGAIAAIFPREDQVVHVAGGADVAAVMEAV
jgi:hypothetical protein